MLWLLSSPPKGKLSFVHLTAVNPHTPHQASQLTSVPPWYQYSKILMWLHYAYTPWLHRHEEGLFHVWPVCPHPFSPCKRRIYRVRAPEEKLLWIVHLISKASDHFLFICVIVMGLQYKRDSSTCRILVQIWQPPRQLLGNNHPPCWMPWLAPNWLAQLSCHLLFSP